MCIDRKPIRDIAVLRSSPALNYNCAKVHEQIMPFEETLSVEKLPWGIIFDGNIDEIDEFRIIALPDIQAVSDAWIEALACGTPVVIPPIGGAAEVVTSADAGRIVARTPEAFAVATRELIAAPPVPDAVSATVKRFTWQANTAALVDHLSSLVVHRRKRDQASSG